VTGDIGHGPPARRPSHTVHVADEKRKNLPAHRFGRDRSTQKPDEPLLMKIAGFLQRRSEKYVQIRMVFAENRS